MNFFFNLIRFDRDWIRVVAICLCCSFFLTQFESGVSAREPVTSGAFKGDDEDDESEDIRFQTVSRLTISFPQDGTQVSRYSNSLTSSFAHLMTEDEIRDTVLLAFQTWAQHSAVNIGLVPDSGEPFGVGGASQGDLRFGDIRVGAVPMAGDVFAVAVPSVDFISGTWSGDLLFNSEATFVDVDQFFAVALHEAGHILGLKHNDDVTSVMHPTALNAILSANDIANLQQLHGARELLDNNDEGSENNDTPGEAEEIENEDEVNGIIPLVAFGDIENVSDVDYFRFRPEGNQHGKKMTFRLISDTVSLLQAKLTVTDERGTEHGSSSSTSIDGSNIFVEVPRVLNDVRLFVRIESIGNPENQFGSYALITTIDENVMLGEDLVGRAIRRNYGDLDQDDIQELFMNGLEAPVLDDLHTNDTPQTATPLPQSLNIALRSYFRIQASIADEVDVDFYQFQVPEESENTGIIAAMFVSVTALSQGGLIPDIQVLDSKLQPILGEIKANGNGELLIDYPGVVPGQTYYVSVSADQPGARYSTGHYDLNVAFGAATRDLPELGSGELSHFDRTQTHTLYVARTQLFHLGLEGTNASTVHNATIWMSIFDHLGELKYRVATRPGEFRTSNSVMLRPGSYTVLVSINVPVSFERRNHFRWIPDANYRVFGIGISDPTGPEVVDPSEDPFAPCDKVTSEFCYPNDRHSEEPFIFILGEEMIHVDPPSNPNWSDVNNFYWQSDWLG